MTNDLKQGLRTWIEIDRAAIKSNFQVFKGLVDKSTNPPQNGRVRIMAVVKSNAYGHGLIDFSREAEALGVDFFGVDSIVEGLALRRSGITKPILVLGYTLPEMISSAADANISLSVSSFEGLEAVQKAKLSKPVQIHIKIDSGMHRQGFLADDLSRVLSKVKGQRLNVHVEGLFTHFAAAKNPAFPKDTRAQIDEFKKWVAAFKSAGLKPIVHAAATGGVMIYPESHFDMVRIGIGLYGLWPEREVKEFMKDRVTLKPILVWKSIVTEIKKLPEDSRIGYGLTERLLNDSSVAVIPVGYWHGYPRHLSSIGRVIIKGKECRVLGTVSMDMISVDVTGVKNLKVRDEVVVIGNDGNSVCSAEGISNTTGLWWYETVTRLNPLIKRIYI